eukprot:m.217051 g.217051  ORF g.217051 m.217051 type:complete len:477 (-) comp33226_c1_seq5:27-1457(-)
MSHIWRYSRRCMRTPWRNHVHSLSTTITPQVCTKDSIDVPRGKGQFGSFASRDVEDLIAMDPEEYTETLNNSNLKPLLYQLSQDVKFRNADEASHMGHKMRESQFLFDPSWTFINHGAFGATLRVCDETANWWRKRAHLQPLRFFDRELLPALVHNLRMLADVLNTPPRTLVSVPNATSALNAVIMSVIQPNDKVLVLSTGYGSVKKMLARAQADVTTVDITVSSELTAADVVELVKSACPAEHKLVIVDHVTSNTALRLPVKEIVDICREQGALTLVDGAHSLMQESVDLEHLRADFFVGNCHKWLGAPSGAAFLCVRDELQSIMLPRITSHGAGHGYVSEFLWDGHRDYAASLSVGTALGFWEEVVPSNEALGYCNTLVTEAETVLCDAWNVKKVVHSSLACNNMRLVQLPHSMKKYFGGADKCQEFLHFNHQIEVPVKNINGVLHVRISAHIYNELADYQRLARAVLGARPNM